MGPPVPFDVQRIYEAADRDRGYRVLVDRLWPRGMTTQAAAIDEWAKDVAPSRELRLWYGHDPQKFDVFAHRYGDELERPPASAVVIRLLLVAREQPVILLTATRDIEHSGAVVLRYYLNEHGR